MVARSFKGGTVVLAVAMILALILSVHPALAQEVGEEGEYTVQEEYRIEINETGDAHITDTITYDDEWFDEYGYLFEENPNLLSRRYRADSNVGEVENFDVNIDSGEATITVTFDTPGLAYNLSDGWTVFGYGDYEVASEGDDEVVLEALWTITNEYSLFEPMGLEEEVIIDLPEGAQGVDYDETTGAIEYDLAYTAKGGGVLASNKTLFTIVFAMIMALSLIFLLFVFTRRVQAPAAVDATGAGISPAAAGTPAASMQAQPERHEAMVSSDEAGATPRFCKKCGHPWGSPDERFCRKCGAPH
jgi:hypothetical protein